MSDRLLKESDVMRIAFQLPLVVNSAFADAVKALPSADRPQGKWIRTGRTNIYGGIEVQCSNCGDRVMVQHLEDEWYCRHCGADMGMKGVDDDGI